MENAVNSAVVCAEHDLLLPRKYFLLASVALAVMVDWLLYAPVHGVTVAIALMITALSCLPRRMNFSNAKRLMGGISFLLVAAGGLLYLPDALSCCMGIIALVVFRVLVKDATGQFDFPMFRRIIKFFLSGWARCFLDYRIYSQNKTKKAKNFAFSVICWVVPTMLSAVFIIIFAAANPLIEQWLGRAIDAIAHFDFSWLDPVRILFWIFCFCWLWGILRMASSTGRPALSEFIIGELKSLMPVLKSRGTEISILVVRCLIFLNAIFLVQNLLDIQYLWRSAALPTGITYASYAHRGAYPLIVAALFSAVFVLVCFGSSAAAEWHSARRLVILWLGQNIFMVISAILRLEKYVNIYSLTVLRVAALVWMTIVAAGLLLIMLKIILNRNSIWLVNANLVMLLVILQICCYCNIRGYIAEYNVNNCRETAPNGEHGQIRAQLDIEYLRSLGIQALPAFATLKQQQWEKFPVNREKIAVYEDELKNQLKIERGNWRSWTGINYNL